MNAIEIRGLKKNFGAKQAVAGLNMAVPAGPSMASLYDNGIVVHLILVMTTSMGGMTIANP